MDITNINQSAAVNLCNIKVSHLLKLQLGNHLLSLPVSGIVQNMRSGLYDMRNKAETGGC